MSGVHMPMTEKAKEQLSFLLANMIEIKSHLIKHCTLWCIKGPSLGASAGITAIVQEEDGHVTILKKLRDAEELDVLQPTLTIPYLQETPKTWVQLILDIYIFDTLVSRFINSFRNSACTSFAENIPKMIEEEFFHEQFSKEWALLLAGSANFKQEFSDEFMKALRSFDGMASSFQSDVLAGELLIDEELDGIYQTFRKEIAAEFGFLNLSVTQEFLKRE